MYTVLEGLVEIQIISICIKRRWAFWSIIRAYHAHICYFIQLWQHSPICDIVSSTLAGAMQHGNISSDSSICLGYNVNNSYTACRSRSSIFGLVWELIPPCQEIIECLYAFSRSWVHHIFLHLVCIPCISSKLNENGPLRHSSEINKSKYRLYNNVYYVQAFWSPRTCPTPGIFFQNASLPYRIK